MTEFEFLDKQFSRLNEARSLRAKDKLEPVKVGRKSVTPHSKFETAEMMMRGAIEDYLQMRKGEQWE